MSKNTKISQADIDAFNEELNRQLDIIDAKRSANKASAEIKVTNTGVININIRHQKRTDDIKQLNRQIEEIRRRENSIKYRVVKILKNIRDFKVFK